MLGFPARPDLQPSNEVATVGDAPPSLPQGSHVVSGAGRAGFLDGLTAILAAGGLVMMFSARADYARWPLLGLLLPGLRVLASSAYRQRLLAVLRGYRASVDAFARGGGVVPWAPAAWLVAAPVFLLYLTNATIEGAIDTRPIIPTAVSLVREADWSLDEFDRPGQPRGLRRVDGAVLKCFQERGGRIYTAYPPGIVAFAVPVAAMARVCGADLDTFWVQLRLEKITAALLGSLCLGLFFLAACRVGPPSAATVATAMLAVASGMFSTVGTGLWQHGAVVFWILAVLLVELRSSGHPLRGGTAVQAIGCAALLACRPTAVILVAGVGLWILARAPRRAIVTMFAAAVCYLPCMAFYHVLYGNVLGPASISTHMSKDLWHFGEIVPLLGVLASPSRGLLIYQPWAVLAALSAVPLIRRKAVAAGFAQGGTRLAGLLPGGERRALHLHRLVVRLDGRALLGLAAAHGHPSPARPGVSAGDRGALATASCPIAHRGPRAPAARSATSPASTWGPRSGTIGPTTRAITGRGPMPRSGTTGTVDEAPSSAGDACGLPGSSSRCVRRARLLQGGRVRT